MTARILVVDDVEANVRLLEAKLTLEYYEVMTAGDGAKALQVASDERPDIILLDVMMPGMDGFETCRRLKADPVTRHIPVVLVTALDGREDKIKGLGVGADDFVTKPIDDVILFARVRSLLRLKSVMDELREREESGRRLGVDTDGAGRLRGSGGRVLIVDDNVRQAERMAEHLAGEHRPTVESDPAAALIAARGPVDLMIVNVSSSGFDGLRFVAQTRSTEASRRTPILAVIDPADRPRLLKALELGVNDILPRPVDPEELEARARTQIKRKRYADFLKQKLDYSLEMAVTDALTGLHNRRYMAGQLQALMSRAGQGGDSVAVLVMDIDHFKLVNDGFGHDAGDEVLREFAVRLATNVRAIDLPCRLGGEEFVVVMPGASLEDATHVADRIRRDVGGQPFPIMSGAEALTVTVSVGVAASTGVDDTPDALLKRADEGVYEAKARGRNQVIARAA
ncbi:MAG: PleD family two-component system response regulator [Alphaproteobacteria bacterium]|uniref:PleD family two-component system response regulator n=1 Tax=Brevundimonas sp. TaxID=1871086 RepID=UPI0017D91597|nr:PleD family two-component system response regulator [Brevundimonas sp.]MBA3048589.1 PleD family two-component system response regulator [Brevundimonas sp.]MBU3974525.1 PleD family two-component system response regulator [Alphaproteobacteria bacterium]